MCVSYLTVAHVSIRVIFLVHSSMLPSMNIDDCIFNNLCLCDAILFTLVMVHCPHIFTFANILGIEI